MAGPNYEFLRFRAVDLPGVAINVTQAELYLAYLEMGGMEPLPTIVAFLRNETGLSEIEFERLVGALG